MAVEYMINSSSRSNPEKSAIEPVFAPGWRSISLSFGDVVFDGSSSVARFVNAGRIDASDLQAPSKLCLFHGDCAVPRLQSSLRTVMRANAPTPTGMSLYSRSSEISKLFRVIICMSGSSMTVLSARTLTCVKLARPGHCANVLAFSSKTSSLRGVVPQNMSAKRGLFRVSAGRYSTRRSGRRDRASAQNGSERSFCNCRIHPAFGI
ncbi:hypothetical protein FB567DRAFT_553437 [Paraphoma chrysanthemicola]|uniref:Uncharacterized protein n=1 Tax=Paraphoma chrysanthemicola TaxID=798071 RepID=A0A8K0VUH2_9PLEO|nr:hypothetical protein FB567DRAFT_553437 [Paraphoma chrysanthemicola]